MDWYKILWSLLAVFLKPSPLLKSILIYCTLSGLLWSPFTAEGVPGSHSEEEEISSSRAVPTNASPVRSAKATSSRRGLPPPGTVEHEAAHQGERVESSSTAPRSSALLEDIGDRAPSSKAQTNREGLRPENVNGLIKKADEYCKKNNGSPYSNVIKIFKREQEFIKDLEEYLNSTYSDSYNITKKLEYIKELVKANNEETKKAIRREHRKQPENSFLQLFLGPDASNNLRLLRIFSHVCTYVLELSYKAAQVIGEIRGTPPSQKLFHIQDTLTKAAEFCLDIRTEDPPSDTLSKLEKFFLKAVDLCTQDESPTQNTQMRDHELSKLKELVQEAYWVLTEKEEEEVSDPLGKVIYLVYLLTKVPGLPEEQKETMAQFMNQYIHYHRPYDVNMTLEESFGASEEEASSDSGTEGWEHEGDPLDSTRIRHRQGSEETLDNGGPSAPRIGGRRTLGEESTGGAPRWTSSRSPDLYGSRGFTEDFPDTGSTSAGNRDRASEAPTGDRQPYVVSGVTTVRSFLPPQNPN